MKIILITVSLLISFYLLYPTPGFPHHPPGSYISTEPADTESTYRRAYYTNLSREELIDYYKQQFRRPFLRQLIPPEDAQTVIRDQTRSSWLEEFIHPLKDSFYVNGFYPTKPTEQINISGVHYQAKIIVRYVPSHPVAGLTILALSTIAGYYLVREYAKI